MKGRIAAPIAAASGAGAALLGVLGLVGWSLRSPALTPVRAPYRPSAPSAVCALAILGLLLYPSYDSQLAPLLASHTRLRVVQAEEGSPIEPNTVYTVPPGCYLGVHAGRLELQSCAVGPGPRMSVDYLFRSLAAELGDRAIGVVLSGSNADGSLGLRAVRGAGGLAIAQDPQTAEYDAMPRSAIATGLVDLVLAPRAIVPAILDYLQHAPPRAPEREVEESAAGAEGLEEILQLLLRAKADFRGYKPGTLLRRIRRQMGISQIGTLSSYVQFLRDRPEEVTKLSKDLLVAVTSFFRDPDAHEALRTLAVRPLVEALPEDRPLRMWVAGCATGEEAYSIAIVAREELQAAQKTNSLQIFASDLDEEALSYARAGIYPESIAADVCALFCVNSPHIAGGRLTDVWPDALDAPKLRTGRQALVAGGAGFSEVEIERDFPGVGRRVMAVSGGRIHEEVGRPALLLLTMEDVTERRRALELAEAMISEVRHRTKNGLAVVAAILEMQADRQYAGEAASSSIRDAVTRIRAFAALYEQVQRGQAETIELVRALQQIADTVRTTITTAATVVTVRGEPLFYPFRASTNLVVVANELITNALKHGDADASGVLRVSVTAERQDGKLTLSVWNSGRPIPGGFDPAATDATGLYLVGTVVRDYYHGEFSLAPEAEGTRATAVLPEDALQGDR